MELRELRDRLVGGYAKYLFNKLGAQKAKKTDGFSEYGYLSEACAAAQQLAAQYDCGLALASGGMYLGFIFELLTTLPVFTVEMKRRGEGAVWNPIDAFDVRDKRVLVFENDVVTGRTLRRAIREILLLKPAQVDLLLVYGHTEVRPLLFQRWSRYLTPDCKVLPPNGTRNICLDTMCQIPRGFGKVMSLEKTFQPLNIPDAVELLSTKLLSKEMERCRAANLNIN